MGMMCENGLGVGFFDLSDGFVASVFFFFFASLLTRDISARLGLGI
jgi:hypothetical protein